MKDKEQVAKIKEFDFTCTIHMNEMYKNKIEKYRSPQGKWDDVVPIVVHPRYEMHKDTY